MTEKQYDIGDPVWTKMKGYCPWPSRIAAPSESTLKNTGADKMKSPKTSYLVYFFGSNNFAWMPEDTIKPYHDFKDKHKNGSKTSQFKQGLKQIEEYLSAGGKATLADTIAAMKNENDNDASPTGAGDNHSNDADNLDGDLPSIDEEIAVINNRKPASGSAASKKAKNNSNDTYNDSHSLASTTAPSNVQRDYSRTPFKSRKTAKSDDIATDNASPTKRAKLSDDDGFGKTGLTSPSISSAVTASKPPTGRAGARNVFPRATPYTDVPLLDTPQINMNYVTPKTKSIRASSQRFGFIGLGFLGQRLLRNLLNSGHHITVWNRTSTKCKEFLEAGAMSAQTPADVVSAADIVFSCLPSPSASKEVVFGTFGILSEMGPSKGFVELGSIDPETSNDISEAIIARGGRYLEAPLVANGKKGAEDGELTVVAAGDRTLYEDCTTCFQAIGKQSFFLSGQVGTAAQMNLTVAMLYGNIVGTIAECCSVIKRAGLQLEEFKDILKLSIMNCPLIDQSLDRILRDNLEVHMPLGHVQKDLRLALNLSDSLDISCPITATTNEVYKFAKRYSCDHDCTSVYMRGRYN